MTLEGKNIYDVAQIDAKTSYKITTALIVPRPIGWIGTRSADGVTNLAPYSFFNAVAASPPTFVIGPSNTGRRDTLDNILATKEFTVNVVSERTVEAMNRSAGSFPAGESEFEICDLQEVAAETVDAPLVGEAIANFECRCIQTVDLGDNTLVIGEATRIHVASRLIDDEGHNVIQEDVNAIGRHAGGLYSRTATTLFTLDRPD